MQKIFRMIPMALLIVVLAMGLVGGDVHTAAYKGTSLCAMCHKNMHKDIVASYEKSAHPKAMQKADVEGAIVADFSTNQEFTKDKVAYVLGAGHHQQAYLDANLQVLPAMWDVKTKAWKPTPALDGAAQCVACHVTGYDPAKKTYAAAGVGCEMCHGPGGDHVGAPNKTTIVNPKNLPADRKSMVCGQCHSAGKDTSGKHPFPVNFRPGDDLTKVFVDAKPAGPGPNQQYSEFIQSKHYKAGHTCETCHDPHGVGGQHGQLKKAVNDLCLGCHAATVKNIATHPDLSGPSGATCSTCHMPDDSHRFAKPGAKNE